MYNCRTCGGPLLASWRRQSVRQHVASATAGYGVPHTCDVIVPRLSSGELRCSARTVVCKVAVGGDVASGYVTAAHHLAAADPFVSVGARCVADPTAHPGAAPPHQLREMPEGVGMWSWVSRSALAKEQDITTEVQAEVHGNTRRCRVVPWST